MSGIYIHIPFCKQACNYCDFHFSTTLKNKEKLVEALCKELQMRKAEIQDAVETIYFGGGTPSLLSKSEMQNIFECIQENYKVKEEAEITLEANPDDLSEQKIKELSLSPINRLSIGVQSFFEADLKWMNRSHNATQAVQALQTAREEFDNISLDLIYGIPGMREAQWKENLEKAIELQVPHISAYALTVEPNTVLGRRVKNGKVLVDDALAKQHYETLVITLEREGFVNYEFSNFGKPGYFSQNNTAYWFGKPYLGIGPSAHGFDGKFRQWNVRNNNLYIRALAKGELPQEKEHLSLTDRYNEYIMTRLRTMWGISEREIASVFGEKYDAHFKREAAILFQKGLLERRDAHVHISRKGKFFGDGISADLFMVE